MNTTRHRFFEGLTVAGSVLLVLLALPVIAVLVFVLRAAVLAAGVGVLAAGLVLTLTSARFRAWLGAVSESEVVYKGLRLATDVALAPGHAWARMEGRKVLVGADGLVPAVLGPVQAVELPPAGRQVARGDVLFRLRHGDRAVEVPSPVSGTVVGGNDAVAREPGLVNQDPFQQGWAVMLQGTPALRRERRGLRRGLEARSWFRGEVDRLLSAVLDGPTVRAMADGGVLADDLYRAIDDETWPRVTATLLGATEPAGPMTPAGR